MKEKKYDIHIDDVWPVSREVFPLGGIGVNWHADIGFGEASLYFTNSGELHADTEYMCDHEDREFLKNVLAKLAEEVIIDG